MSVTKLHAELREHSGTGSARNLRRAKRIPAVLYGPGQPNHNLSVDQHEIGLQLSKPGFTSRVIDLQLDGKHYKVLPRNVSYHPVSDAVEHIDFFSFGNAKQVQLKVRLRFTNQEKSPGLKLGGVLNIVQRELVVRCAPENIPSVIDIDVANMKIGDSMRIALLELPHGVEAINRDPKGTVATITGRAKKDEAADEAGKAATPAAAS